MVFQGVLNRSPRRLQLYNATIAWPDKYRFNHPDTPRNHAEYMRTLTQFDFCFTPDGHVRSTVRLFEALVTGCIPVVWSPGLQLPFTHTIDYRDIQITFNASATRTNFKYDQFHIKEEVEADAKEDLNSDRVDSFLRPIRC